LTILMELLMRFLSIFLWNPPGPLWKRGRKRIRSEEKDDGAEGYNEIYEQLPMKSPRPPLEKGEKKIRKKDKKKDKK
jgi:hypothetical protein